MVQRRQPEREAAEAVTGFVSAAASHTLADGLILVAPGGDAVVDAILEDGYELNELDFVRATVRTGDAVLDLGAHLGAYTLRLAQLVGSSGRVTAVEASAAHVAWLRQSIEANGFQRRTNVIHAAACNVAGTAWLRHPPGDSSSAHRWLGEDGAVDAEPVTTICVDDVIDGAVQFIKVDVEGAEGLALRGAQRLLERSRPTLLVELHPHLLPVVSGESAGSLIAWVVSRGYECRLLGAGQPGEPISDTPSNGVTSAVFLPK